MLKRTGEIFGLLSHRLWLESRICGVFLQLNKENQYVSGQTKRLYDNIDLILSGKFNRVSEYSSHLMFHVLIIYELP
jgi:hypothetical protein